MSARRKVLFVAEAVTLAHVVRLVSLAGSLDAAQNEVALATDPRFNATVGRLPFRVHAIESMPAATFYRAISRGTPIFSTGTLARYVADDLRLIEAVAPDMVVGDFRISLATSARLVRVPYINLTNAYWSPYSRIRYVVPELDHVRITGVRLGQWLFDATRRLGYAVHAIPPNRIRREHGQGPLPLDFRYALVDGDLTCYADIPEIISAGPLPPTHRFIGPVPWSPRVALPAWWEGVAGRAHETPVVYVTLGNSGPPDVLQRVLDALEALPVAVVAATAERASTLGPTRNSHVAEYLPGDEVARVARVVVCNGGSPACYQALAEGRPVVGLATNMDQFLNMAAVEDAGCGTLLRSSSATADEIRVAVRQALEDIGMVRRAEEIQRRIRVLPASTAFASALAEVART
ncbi:MAG: glycosyltransferase [Candidatus Rokuibacteriota bacterium]